MKQPARDSTGMPMRIVLLTCVAMIAFAANSILCRLALQSTTIDAASFTSIRLGSGAILLLLLFRKQAWAGTTGTSWTSAAALFVYAAGFSFAYISLPAGTGALLLFGAVQVTMIGWGLLRGERLSMRQMSGFALAVGGLVVLFLPGLSAPPLQGAILMAAAGIAWGIYSLRGRAAGDPAAATAGNFLRATPLAIALSLSLLPWARIDLSGAVLAAASGAIASGLGYVVWYTALRGLSAARAAAVQLSVPVITALAAIVLLGESATLRLLLASAAILGGIACVIYGRKRLPPLVQRTA